MHVWLTVRRRLLTCSQIGFVGLFFLCLLAPFQAYADPLTVTVGPDQPFVDWTVTFEEGDILDMKVSTGIDCPLDFAVTPDPYVQLLEESMGVDYQDDDGAHNDVGDCYSSRLFIEEPVGTFTLRFNTYQTLAMNEPVPEGTWVVTFGEGSWTPVPPTTTTSTTTTTTTTIVVTTTSAAQLAGPASI